jgi:hypothetical protein
MATKSIFFNSQFFTPNSEKYSFYWGSESNSSYLDYIKREEALEERNMDVVKDELEISLHDEGLDFSHADYMGSRTGSVGLFDYSKNAIISKPSEAIKPHSRSNIWTWVVSFDKDLTQNNDFTNQWMSISKKVFSKALSYNGLEKSNFTFQAALHKNTSHHHIHFRVYQPSNVSDEEIVKKGVLKVNTHLAIKTSIANMISTEFKEILRENNATKMQLKSRISSYVRDSKELALSIYDLKNTIDKIKGHSGRLTVNTIKSDVIKIHLGKIINKIEKSSFISPLHQVFLEKTNESFELWSKGLLKFLKSDEKYKAYFRDQKKAYIKDLRDFTGNKVLEELKIIKDEIGNESRRIISDLLLKSTSSEEIKACKYSIRTARNEKSIFFRNGVKTTTEKVSGNSFNLRNHKRISKWAYSLPREIKRILSRSHEIKKYQSMSIDRMDHFVDLVRKNKKVEML